MYKYLKLAGSLLIVMSMVLFAYACSKEEEIPVGTIRVTFVANGETSIQLLKTDGSSDFVMPQNPTRDGYVFGGWYWDNGTFNEPFTVDSLLNRVLTNDLTVYSKWIEAVIPIVQVDMVQVGEIGTVYTIPVGTDDSGAYHVRGGYSIATTPTTYELWFEVLWWAEANGYQFDNLGREGSNGNIGLLPTEEKKHEPVTTVSWHDVIVWTNALSEMTGINPVYRTPNGEILKDSRTMQGCLLNNGNDCYKHIVDAAVQTSNNGYRLPTSMEWEMAARWRNGSGDGSILVGDRYWTPGSYASGATADYNNEAATREVAWYGGASGGTFTHDMSGNVFEWTFTPSGSRRAVRGGSYYDYAYGTQVGDVYYSNPGYASVNYGFRLILGQ